MNASTGRRQVVCEWEMEEDRKKVRRRPKGSIDFMSVV
jgi:hypothetical protein